MTEREFLSTIIAANISDEITDHAKKNVAKLDKRNATPSKAEREKREANEAIKVQIATLLADGATRVASEIATAIEVSTSKASALLRQMSEAGEVSVSEVKIKGKGKVKGYALATTDAE